MHCFCCGFSIFSKYLAQADTGTFRSPEHFHSLVQKEILRYQDCFSRSSVRSCAYNVTLSTEAEVCSLTAWGRICFFLFVCYSCLSPAKKKIWSISMLKIQAWEVYAIWSKCAKPALNFLPKYAEPIVKVYNCFILKRSIPLIWHVLKTHKAKFWWPFAKWNACLIHASAFLLCKTVGRGPPGEHYSTQGPFFRRRESF